MLLSAGAYLPVSDPAGFRVSTLDIQISNLYPVVGSRCYYILSFLRKYTSSNRSREILQSEAWILVGH